MKIQDLSKELDAKTSSAVRGGDNGNAVTNTIGQVSAISVPVMVGSAGPGNTSVHVNGTQNAAVGNALFGGDSYLVGMIPTAPIVLSNF